MIRFRVNTVLNKSEYLLKICAIGSGDVQKTEIIRKYTDDKFDGNEKRMRSIRWGFHSDFDTVIWVIRNRYEKKRDPEYWYEHLQYSIDRFIEDVDKLIETDIFDSFYHTHIHGSISYEYCKWDNDNNKWQGFCWVEDDKWRKLR